ncbi:MAG TPA: tryptophan synthase subunit alpha [Candidatus Nitrosopolaris sp.]|nr:tryptophan synthase subunit alpha [Candidatus Nitrosopolaris sp.]
MMRRTSLGNNRLNQKFQELAKKNEAALICYVVAGYPNISTTNEILSSIIKGGADIIEIGIPFSDPIADGPTIQEASYRALLAGVTPEKSLEISKKIRKKYPFLPVVILTYSNILQRAGFEYFMKKSKECGVDGFILPDMAIEESDKYVMEASRLDLATIFLASPNTAPGRLEAILARTSGFMYVVSVYGITGQRSSFEDYSLAAIRNVKHFVGSRMPVAVGFGISSPSHIKPMIRAGADAIIVGSALVNIIRNVSGNRRRMLQQIEVFVRDLKKACRQN